MTDHPRDCQHGYQWGHCPYCDLYECEIELQEARRLLERYILDQDAHDWKLEDDILAFLGGNDADSQ